jgi:hypothetical protein
MARPLMKLWFPLAATLYALAIFLVDGFVNIHVAITVLMSASC